MQDQIGYDEIIENSMRMVISETLKKIEKTGLLGQHYFVITFLTRFPGVEIAQSLMERYPDEMTIVIQYQYRGLVVEHDFFKIALSFNGKYETLTIPYKSITSFADPSMNFALKFSMTYNDLQDLESEDYLESDPANSDLIKKREIDLSAKVISLDAFGKNQNTTPSE